MDIFPALVERIRNDPSALAEALAVLDHWDNRGIGPPARRAEWRKLLRAAMDGAGEREVLIRLLLNGSESARRLKDFAPFAGVLSREQRRSAFTQCAYDH